MMRQPSKVAAAVDVKDCITVGSTIVENAVWVTQLIFKQLQATPCAAMEKGHQGHLVVV